MESKKEILELNHVQPSVNENHITGHTGNPPAPEHGSNGTVNTSCHQQLEKMVKEYELGSAIYQALKK